MKRPLVILLILVSFEANAQPTGANETLRSYRESFTASMIAGNGSLLQYAAEDIRLMPEFSLTVITKANASKYYQAFHGRFDITTYARKESEVLDLGSRIVEWGSFTMSLVIRAGNSKKDIQGKYMDIWMKDTSGKLSLITQAWNYNHRIDFGDQLKFVDVPVSNVALAAHTPVDNAVSFELAAMNKLMEAIIVQHDGSRWKMFYSDDGNFLYSNSPVYQGRTQLDSFLDEHVSELPIFEALDIRNDRIDNLGSYIIEYASHTAFVRGGNWSGTGTGKDIRIWRREKDCSLKIFRHIGMYD